MVSPGNVVSAIVAGAVIASGYGLYVNREKIGAALSRGVESTITNPLGNYFENLFQHTPDSGNGRQEGIPSESEMLAERRKADQEQARLAFEQKQYDLRYGIQQAGYEKILSGYEKTLKEILEKNPDEPYIPPEVPPSQTEHSLPEQQEETPGEPPFAPSPEGYYYNIRRGVQQRLNVGTADRLRDRDWELEYLGVRKLGEEGLDIFKRSKGY